MISHEFPTELESLIPGNTWKYVDEVWFFRISICFTAELMIKGKMKDLFHEFPELRSLTTKLCSGRTGV